MALWILLSIIGCARAFWTIGGVAVTIAMRLHGPSLWETLLLFTLPELIFLAWVFRGLKQIWDVI